MNEEQTIGRDAWDIEQMKARLARHAYFVEPYTESVSASIIAVQAACERTPTTYRLVGIVESVEGWHSVASNAFGHNLTGKGSTIVASLDSLANALTDYEMAEGGV